MTRSQHAGALLVMCALAVIAYLPAQSLPFIADDYVQIHFGREYGPVAFWPALLKDPLYRCRATSILLTHWTEGIFGLNPLAFNLSSLFLHTANVVLIYCVGLSSGVGQKRSAVMAVFFAIAEGHQEAVIWYAALPELLVFLFSGLTFLAFSLALDNSGPRTWYVASLISFVLTIASKESGVAVIAALMLTSLVHNVPLRRAAWMLLPFVVTASAYVLAIFWSSSDILHFHDGAFSIGAPVVATVLNSASRILWFWGFTAIVLLIVLDRAALKAIVPAALCWMLMALVPYSFLTYMNRVPSRHTYLASAGLSLIVATGLVAVFERRKNWMTAGVFILALLHNCGYLWTKKQRQYERRAQPTEELVRVYRQGTSGVSIECFPYSQWIARYAIEIGAKNSWDNNVWRIRGDCGEEETRLIVKN